MKGIFNYSNFGYIILGVLIEKVKKINYSEFIKKYIVSSLNMNNTGFDKCNIRLYNKKNEEINVIDKQTKYSSAG
jgi:CubicO group peptidase (beta-lactamase class C family)